MISARALALKVGLHRDVETSSMMVVPATYLGLATELHEIPKQGHMKRMQHENVRHWTRKP